MEFFGDRLRQIRDRAPVGRLLVLVWIVVVIWLSLSGALIEHLRWAEIGMGGRGGGLWFPMRLLSAVKPAAMFVLFVAVVYTPGLMVLAGLFDRRLNIRLTLRHEYAGALSCVLAAVLASVVVQILPMIVVASLVRESDVATAILLLPVPVYVVLMVPVVGLLFSQRPVPATLLTLLSLGFLMALPVVMHAAATVCASPLLILLLFFLLRDRIDDVVRNSRARNYFQRQLQLATVNPADASAHYNLGLIYQQRGDLAEAKRSFTRAVQIDSREVDAHYQLGRIAREEGALTEALEHFSAVIAQDQGHSQHEVWREVGRMYYAAGQYGDALGVLDRFVSLRPSDAEGRYWRGMVLERLGRGPEAVAEMRECVEAAQTSPAYKYRQERRWLAMATDFLRTRADS